MKRSSGPEEIYGRARLAWPPLALIATLIWASAVARTPPEAPNIAHFDKIAHFFVFGLMGTHFFRLLRIGFLEHRRWLTALGCVLAFGVVDEAMQYFNPVRSFDPYDWVADFSGALLAIGLYRNWTWYRSLLEFPLWGRKARVLK